MYSSAILITCVGFIVWTTDADCEKFSVSNGDFNGIKVLRSYSNLSHSVHSAQETESVYLRCENSEERIQGTNQRMTQANLLNRTHFKSMRFGIKKIDELVCALAHHEGDYVSVTETENGDIRQLQVYVTAEPNVPVYIVWFNVNSLTTIRTLHTIDLPANSDPRPAGAGCWAAKFWEQTPGQLSHWQNFHSVLDPEIKMKYDATTYQSDVFRRHQIDPVNLIGVKQGFDRGHLVPNGDFNDSNKRTSTFYYFNAVPMYWSINRHGIWRRLEDFLRRNPPFERLVETGAKSVLTYQGTPLHLELTQVTPSRVPIPLYLWKNATWIVGTENREVRVLFVILNNPFPGAGIDQANILRTFPECEGGIDENCKMLSTRIGGDPAGFGTQDIPGVDGLHLCCYTPPLQQVQ